MGLGAFYLGDFNQRLVAYALFIMFGVIGSPAEVVS